MVAFESIAVTFIAGTVVGGILTHVGKGIFEYIQNLKCSIQSNVKRILKRQEIDMVQDTKPIIINKNFSNALRKFFYESTIGGVWIVGAPSGSGKTTYIGDYIAKLRQDSWYTSRIAVFDGNAIVPLCLHKALSINENERLSEYIPKGYKLIIDQVDIKESLFSLEMQNYIVRLATDSRNSKRYAVLICVSDPTVMRIMLSLNNYDKISELCPPSYLHWNEDLVRKFIDEKYTAWEEDEKNRLFELTKSAKSCGALINAGQHISVSGSGSKPSYIESNITRAVTNKNKLWDIYEEVFEGYEFYELNDVDV